MPARGERKPHFPVLHLHTPTLYHCWECIIFVPLQQTRLAKPVAMTRVRLVELQSRVVPTGMTAVSMHPLVCSNLSAPCMIVCITNHVTRSKLLYMYIVAHTCTCTYTCMHLVYACTCIYRALYMYASIYTIYIMYMYFASEFLEKNFYATL